MIKKITSEYVQELNLKTLNALNSPKYDYYFLYDYNKKYLNQDFTDVIEFISVNDINRIIGHIYVLYDKDSNVIRDAGIIKFTESFSDTRTFGVDIKEVFRIFFEDYKIEKSDWICCINNPLFKTYDKIYKSKNNSLGVNMIGPLRNHVLINGKYEDAMIIEITKEEYFKNKKIKND